MPYNDYLVSLITPLLRFPESLTVAESQDPMGVLLTIKVHKEDMRFIVGTSGATAKAIRHLVRIVGMKAGARVSVRISEPEGTTFNFNQ